jgi:hypothetical protein
MDMERVCDRIVVVPRLRLEQPVSHERVEFRLVQFDPQAAEAVASALAMAAHPFGRTRAGN